MKDLNIQIAIKIYEYEELNAADRELLDAARQATYRSYAPYSHFSVGAAARLANNIIVTGTNQENAAYPSGLCAERTTLFYANSQYPDQAVETLAIAARNERGDVYADGASQRHRDHSMPSLLKKILLRISASRRSLVQLSTSM